MVIWSSRAVPAAMENCEAAISEAYHLLGPRGAPSLRALLRRRAVVVEFDLGADLEPVLKTLEKYDDRPASVADACIVRMTETLAEALVLTTDSDFGVYRRHGRKVIRCVLPE